jgi:hypothetical protein
MSPGSMIIVRRLCFIDESESRSSCSFVRGFRTTTSRANVRKTSSNKVRCNKEKNYVPTHRLNPFGIGQLIQIMFYNNVGYKSKFGTVV